MNTSLGPGPSDTRPGEGPPGDRSSENQSENQRRDIRLYLDNVTEESFRAEADHHGVSFSAYVRVVGRVISEWYKSPFERPVEDLRTAVSRIIQESDGKV